MTVTRVHARNDYFGTAAERAGLSLPSDAVGTRYLSTDTSAWAVWTGSAWLAAGGTVAAADVSITDSGGYFTATDVEAALQEIADGYFDDQYLLESNNLSDLDNAATARTNLGLAIGTNVQAWDAQLDDIAALAVTDGNIIVGDGANWVAESGATARTSLGLVAGGAGDIWVEKAGDTMTGALTIDGGGLVVNESGGDYDTRIEGDTDANLVYVDAGNDRVGIGTSSPTHKFHMNSGTSDVVAKYESTDQYADYIFKDSTSYAIVRGGSGRQHFYVNSGYNESFRLNADKSARFFDNLNIAGSLSKGSGSFYIDHPVDPKIKTLRYGFVESPRYDLVHRGTINLRDGFAVVDIDKAYGLTPGTFEALVTNAAVMSVQAMDSYVRVKASKINGACFEIEAEDEKFAGAVNWFVLAERNDAYVKYTKETNENGTLINEEDKIMPNEEAFADRIKYVRDSKDIRQDELEPVIDEPNIRGYYMHPEAFGSKQKLMRNVVWRMEK